MKKLLAHREHSIPALSAVRSDVPAPLNTIFKKMIAKKAEDRYQTVSEVIAALSACDMTNISGTKFVNVVNFCGNASEPTAVFVASTTKPELSKTSRMTDWSSNRLAMIGGGVLCVVVLMTLLARFGINRQPKSATQVKKVDQSGAVVPVRNPESKAPTLSASVDLLKLIDPTVHALKGDWRISEGSIRSPDEQENWALLRIPFEPPRIYYWELEVERLSERGSGLALFFASAGNQGMVYLEGFGSDKVSTLEMIDGKEGQSVETSYRKAVFTPGKSNTIRVSVVDGGITVDVDGKQILAWAGDLKRFSTFSVWNVPDKETLFVGSQSAFLIRTMRLFPLK